jgi:hypothetical protein
VARNALVAVMALVVVAAAVVVALVLTRYHHGTPQARTSASAKTSPVSSTGPIPQVTNNSPSVIKAIDGTSATLPAGFTEQSFSPSQTGTKAGFSMALPQGWQVRQQPGSAQVFFKAPDGVSYVEADLTGQDTSDMVAALQSTRQRAISKNQFPGYKLIDFTAQNIRGTRGALWRFDWVNSSNVTMRVDDILFTLQTANGPQVYAIYLTTPEGSGPGKFGGNDGLLATTIIPMLQSFQPAT